MRPVCHKRGGSLLIIMMVVVMIMMIIMTVIMLIAIILRWLSIKVMRPAYCVWVIDQLRQVHFGACVRHCIMVKLKNGVKISQIWKIISPPIFNENLPNFGRCCINIQKIIWKNLFAKYYEKIFLNSKKPVGWKLLGKNSF